MQKLLFLALAAGLFTWISCTSETSAAKPQSKDSNLSKDSNFQLCTIVGPTRSTADSLLGDGALLWNKKFVYVFFMDDDGNIRNEVLNTANSWKPYTGVTFVRTLDQDKSDIRVSFLTKGWWSHIGTACTSIGKDSVTLSLDALYSYEPAKRRSVILHEFGHALGLLHEHQHKDLAIPWNKPVLYKYYKETFNVDSNWVIENVIDKDLAATNIYCEPDTTSIMIYAIPAHVTTNGFKVKEPNDLSPLDKRNVSHLYKGESCRTYSKN